MTVATEETRHSIDMGAKCVSCTGRSFRRSRLKVKDMWSLLALRYPVRCLACSKRQTASLSVARRAISSKVVQGKNSTAWNGEGSTDEAGQRERPSTIGGVGSWNMPVHEPMTMPELQGVTLKHTGSLSVSDENPKK